MQLIVRILGTRCASVFNHFTKAVFTESCRSPTHFRNHVANDPPCVQLTSKPDLSKSLVHHRLTSEMNLPESSVLLISPLTSNPGL